MGVGWGYDEERRVIDGLGRQCCSSSLCSDEGQVPPLGRFRCLSDAERDDVRVASGLRPEMRGERTRKHFLRDRNPMEASAWRKDEPVTVKRAISFPFGLSQEAPQSSIKLKARK